ncbi:MAG: S-DNA-T family DNA segregation ATPase FtsK/SpoIIIE [Candidatus Azotimanducaceae bacterium]|jgi:S-DNA-T family DNA segregation ATPase FtsK/SpoIIIE
MARRKKKSDRKPFFDDLSPHAKQAIGAVAFVVLGIFFTLSLFDFAGDLGRWIRIALDTLFGGGAYLAPFVCVFYVYALLNPREDQEVSTSKIIGIALLFVSLLGLLELYKVDMGGWVGWLIEFPLAYLMAPLATGIVLGATVLVSLFLTFNIGIHNPFAKQEVEELEEEDEYEEAEEEDEELEEDEEVEEEEVPTKKSVKERLGLSKSADFAVSSFSGPYAPPPLSLLHKDKGKAKSGDVKANSNIIKRTLKKFNIEVEMDEVQIGPAITRYALKPAEGVRISKIVGLQKELELNLASGTIRIEAPIPGKSLVGIEVPNITKPSIGLASLLASPEYTDSPQPLLVALGKDITGKPVFQNVARMPHGLIAGTTGAGKSVTIHNLIVSLLFRNSPEQLRFIMIDPKRVELTFYDGIPHLLTPVITEAKKALLALKWAIKEMERRYDVLQTEKVRDIGSYHKNIYDPAKDEWGKDGSPEEEKDNLPEPMPYIVIFIDELSDLMQAYPRELESSIVRLAQMSRAVGIHLILATQRPEVKVITGLIKANVPFRIALKVNSQIDSRTILDKVGAEKLLGKGDMLYHSSDSPDSIRVMAAYITEEETKRVVDYLKNQSGAQELDSISFDDNKDSNPDAFFESMAGNDDDDDLYEEARDAVVEAGKASTSWLQRKFRIGYSRAARLMDILEERGVIGAADGAKAREVLMGNDEDEDMDEEDGAEK